MTYFGLIKSYSDKEKRIGIEVLFNGEHMLLKEKVGLFKLNKLNKKGTDFLSTGIAAKNNYNLTIISDENRLWNDDDRKVQYKKLFKNKKKSVLSFS